MTIIKCERHADAGYINHYDKRYRMAKAGRTTFSLHQYLSKIQRNEIVRCFKEHKQDELGCLLCEHALKQLQSYLQNHGEFTMDYHRINRDGDHNLHAVKEFKAMKGLLPVALSDFSKDQWGYSNQIKADAIYVMHVRDKYGQIKQTIPLFIEVDSGVEPEKKKKYRRAAMKMWQYTAAGHLIPNVDFVATLRMETQIVDRELAEWAKLNTENMTPEKLIVQNYFDITCACAEIFYALAMSVVYRLHRKTNGDKHKQVDMDGIDANFYETLHSKDTGKKKRELWDYHFFIGHFEFNTFLFGSDRVLEPKPEPAKILVQQAFNKFSDLYTQYGNESNDKFQRDFGLSKQDMQSYFKNTTPKFYDHSGDNSFSENNPRFLDGFWGQQRNWRCHMKYANKIFFASSKGSNASGTVQKVYGHSKIHMHSVSVARADLNQLKLEQLTSGGAMELPQNMYYWKEIVGLLDQYISLTPDNPDDLTQNISYSFDLKTAKIRIPESHRYWTTSQQVNSNFKKHFFKYSGYHLFIEPFTGAMENTLLTLAEDMSNNSKMLEHKNYSKQISALRLELKREDVVLFDNEKPHIEMPKTSCNLAIMCLKTYHDRDSAYSHISHQYDLQPELEIYLNQNFNNEFLKAFCKMARCNNKVTLLTMVQRYMHDETVHASIQNKILCFPAAVQAEIYDMLEFIYNDATYNLVTSNKKEDGFEKALFTTDDKLLTGILVLVVRNFWIPYLVYIDLDRALVYGDGDLDYTNGKWKIFDFTTSTQDVDTEVKHRNAVREICAITAGRTITWTNYAQFFGLYNKYFYVDVNKQQHKNFFVMRLNNNSINDMTGASEYAVFEKMIQTYEDFVKENYKREFTAASAYNLHIDPFNDTFMKKLTTFNKRFEWRRIWLQKQFSDWRFLNSHSDKNHIYLSLQLFFKCANHLNAFEHCYIALSKFVKYRRKKQGLEEDDDTQDSAIFQTFDVDIGDDMVRNRVQMTQKYKQLSYSVPFYEMYKAMYISILFAHWWCEILLHESPDTERAKEKWSQCLNKAHKPFQSLAKNIFTQFGFTFQDQNSFSNLRLKYDDLCKWPTDLPVRTALYNINAAEYTRQALDPAQNLLHDDVTTAPDFIQKLYFDIKRHAAFVARHYASIVELEAFLLSHSTEMTGQFNLSTIEFENPYNNDAYYTQELNFENAEAVYDRNGKYKDNAGDDMHEYNKYNVPSSLQTVQDPILARVKSFYALEQHDFLPTDFQRFIHEVFGSPTKVRKYKYFQTVIFTQMPYEIPNDDIPFAEPPQDLDDDKYFESKIFEYNNDEQQGLRNKYLFTAQTLNSTNTSTGTISQLCSETDMEATFWLLYRIMQTFCLISQSTKKKRTQLQMFLFQKFECLREYYMPYTLKMHNITAPRRDNFLYEEYYKDLLFSLRKFESLNKAIQVLEHKDDNEYLEPSTLDILWTRRDVSVDSIHANANNCTWYNKKVRKDQEQVIASAFFNTKQVFARALHIAWSWKWCMLKYIAIREYEILSKSS